ncbi:MAG: rod shape-determining protein RodA [Leptospiraceae bacterium]|nr:MAG: rod shape-determining protein RodA [Leptospiraceae bacterium]
MKLKFDWTLFFAIISATIIGIITLYTQDYYIDEPSQRWLKQLIFLIPALMLFYFLYKLNYHTLGTYSIILYVISIFLLLITLIPFIGSEIKGARSWIRLGPIGLQTSEFAKFASIIILAKYLELKERDMNQLSSLFIPSILFLIPMLLIVVQPDLGGAIIFAPILLSMLFIGGADILHIISIVMFFSISLLIPLYIEYHNIILIDNVIERLSSLDKMDLIPTINILKSQIWIFLEKMKIPDNLSQSDIEYLNNILQNSVLFTELKQIAFSVRYKEGGLLLKILDNDTFLLIVSISFLTIAGILFIIRFTQGTIYKHLRKYYIPLGVLGISILSAYIIHNTFSLKYHQVVRVTAFINPDKFPQDLAYQIRASKAAIGSGEFFGKGLYSAEMTTGLNPLVPEAFTDFIFTSWAERTGFLGSTFLLIILSLIPIRGFYISYSARDRFGSLLAAGISFLFLYHIGFNIGIEIGLLPVTGLPLSFVSYGGSHLLLCYSCAGVLESIYSKKYIN